MDNNFIDFPYSLSSRVWGSTTRSPNDISIRNNLIEKAKDKVASFQISPPPSPLAYHDIVNDVSRWKKRKKGEINNRVLNWPNRWQEWKLYIFSWRTPVSLYSSLSPRIRVILLHRISFHAREYSSLFQVSSANLSSRFAILFISNREI